MDPIVTAELVRLLDDEELVLDDGSLAQLAPLFDAFAALERPDANAVADVRTRLAATLSATAATALCESAQSLAEVAERFARLVALAAARAALGPRGRGPPRG